MISTPKNYYKLIRLLLDFVYPHSRIFFLQNVWINNSSFMPEELITFGIMLWEYFGSLFFKHPTIIWMNRIPKFTFALM